MALPVRDRDLISGIAGAMIAPGGTAPPAARADAPEHDRRLDAMIEALQARGIDRPLVCASRLGTSRRWLVTVTAGTFAPGAFRADRLDDAIALAEAHVATLPAAPPAAWSAPVRREG